ncbi:MAG: S-layer homology domain-containing protein [Candidatus Wallbacteria bacterium]|nr:S-layer homology domain-containing protein [Candidatus Wallbacteria bacterium]
MVGRRFRIAAVALAGLFGCVGAWAQELDGQISADPSGVPCVLKDDIDGKAREVGKLKGGDLVRIYLQISSSSHYFVKLKSSAPGEGSGWVPRSRVELAKPETASEPAEIHAIASAKLETAAGSPSVKRDATGEKNAPEPLNTDRWDIPKDHWARTAIEELAKNGLLRVPAGHFDGDKTVTRYEMTVLAQRLFARSKESAEQLGEQLRKVEGVSDKAAADVKKLAGRIKDVEVQVAKLAHAPAPALAAAGTNHASIEGARDLSRDIDSLRQTFTRSIAGLALDRSKVEDYSKGWQAVLGRLDSIEKKLREMDSGTAEQQG